MKAYQEQMAYQEQQQMGLARQYQETQKLSPFDPRDLQQAMQVADMLSKSSLVPTAFRGKPADILLVIMGGRELGFSTVQSLRSFFVINGKLGMYADAMVAVCIGKPQCKYFRLIESTPLVATYETQREGSEPVRLSFTMEQAKKAGYSSNQNYSKNPDAMLRARCASALGRIVYPDFLAGVYDPSELEDSVAAPVAVRAAKAPSVDRAPAAAADVVIDVPRVVVEDDEVSAPPEPATGESSFKAEPEWNDEDPGEKQRIKEAMFKLATFPSGSMRGQFLEAAPVSLLAKTLAYVKQAESKKSTDVLFAQALQYWLDVKSDEAWTGVT